MDNPQEEEESLMTLYQYETCPYCAMVRKKLSDLLLTYVSVSVPMNRREREEVVRISGQPLVPVLVDGDLVLSDEDAILRYLEEKYSAA